MLRKTDFWTNLRIYLGSFVFLIVICFLYACIKNKSLVQLLLSASVGFLCFLLPEMVCHYYSIRKHWPKLTANLVVYDAIVAIILKFMLVILLLGISFKYFYFDNLFIIFSFIFTICIKIMIYSVFPTKFL